VRRCWSALGAAHHGGVREPMMDEGEDWIRQAYGAEVRALKRKYGPDNFFRLDQHPAGLIPKRSTAASG
jgi:hypothetical protein